MHLSSAAPLRPQHEHKKQLMVSRHCHMAAAFDTTPRPLTSNINSQKIDQNKAICLAHFLDLTSTLTNLSSTVIELDSSPKNIS